MCPNYLADLRRGGFLKSDRYERLLQERCRAGRLSKRPTTNLSSALTATGPAGPGVAAAPPFVTKKRANFPFRVSSARATLSPAN